MLHTHHVHGHRYPKRVELTTAMDKGSAIGSPRDARIRQNDLFAPKYVPFGELQGHYNLHQGCQWMLEHTKGKKVVQIAGKRLLDGLILTMPNRVISGEILTIIKLNSMRINVGSPFKWVLSSLICKDWGISMHSSYLLKHSPESWWVVPVWSHISFFYHEVFSKFWAYSILSHSLDIIQAIAGSIWCTIRQVHHVIVKFGGWRVWWARAALTARVPREI